MTIHATAVAIEGRAVLLFGPSGSGKSDLAFRLIDRGAVLIADDRVIVEGGRAQCPLALVGKLEIRGIGIVAMPHLASAPVALAVDLTGTPDRLPETGTREIDGKSVPETRLNAFEASAPQKVELALRLFGLPLEDGSR
jgi:serine kinase of HPr protein (carbohydrate metabolism regulator)